MIYKAEFEALVDGERTIAWGTTEPDQVWIGSGHYSLTQVLELLGTIPGVGITLDGITQRASVAWMVTTDEVPPLGYVDPKRREDF
jgi:hypothetical protein